MAVDMLVVVQGNHQGQRYPIGQERITIGRERHCEIVLDDEGISRRHAAVYRKGRRVFVEDLGSTNGTYCNNLLLQTPCGLSNGDRIAMGNTVMLAQIENPSSTAQRVVVSDRDHSSDSVIKLDVTSTSIFDLVGEEEADKTVVSRPGDAGQQSFLALYEFIAQISGILNIEVLCDQAIEQAVRVCGADRGAILLLDRKAELVPRATYTRMGEDDVAVSRTLLEEVLTYRKGLLSQEVAKDKRFRHTQTINRADISSLMCVPLLSKDKALGALYVDTMAGSARFTEQTLRLLSAMAVQLSTCVENASLYTMLKDSEEFGACVLKSMAGGLLVVDQQGRIVRANEPASQLIGLSVGELLGGRLARIDALAELNILVGQTLQSGRGQETDSAHLVLEGPPPRRLPVSVNTAVLEDYAGRPIGVVVHFRDMTRLRELGEQVKRAERLGALGQMASGIAHEIRNPLNSVQGFVQLLGERVSEEELKHFCSIVLEEVARINRIVQEMLDFSRQQPPSMETLDPLALAMSIHEQVAGEAGAQDVALSFAAPQDEMPFTHGNADKLKQVLLNLVRNAVQATAAGGEVTLRLDCVHVEAEHRQMVRLAVSDTGRGIPPEDLSRIFDPFFTTKDEGTGLGLSICQNIAEQHDGRITVESVPDQGSTFTLWLPALRGRGQT